MLIVLSPAKKLDFETENLTDSGSIPALLEDAIELVEVAKQLKAEDLKRLMGISDNLADLNVQRFQKFETPFTSANARPALDAFKGDVYVGLDAPSLDDAGRAFADKHVRILSGLYGVLKPLDLMQAYRLEMGTKFKTNKGHNLYQYWEDRITEVLNQDLGADMPLVNLASTEYFKSVKTKLLNGPVITPVFKEIKDGKAHVISFSAKKARGLMTRWIIDHQITQVQALKEFSEAGYAYDDMASSDTEWVFSRVHA